MNQMKICDVISLTPDTLPSPLEQKWFESDPSRL